MTSIGKQVRRIVPAVVMITACTGGDDAVAQTREQAHAEVRERLGDVPAVLDTAAAAALSSAFRGAAERALPAVVFVAVEATAQAATTRQTPWPEGFPRIFPMDPDPQPQRGTGSGFIIDEQGHIVTNNHVVANARSLTVRLVDGREYNAELVGTDPATDIALIRITPGRGEQLPVATFGDSDRLRVGDWVLALGNPLGLDFSVTAGIVSAKGRRIPGSELQLESFIQTDAAINMGNSGGPMVDLLGRVVGVNTAIFGGGNRFVGYGFAVPSTLVQKVVSDIKTYGHARRPRLGAYVSNVTPADVQVYGLPRQQGAEISSLEAGEAAERAGLRVGDVVVAVDGVAIVNADDFITTLARHQPGDRVRFTIYRDRQRRDVTVQLGEFARPRAEPAVAATGGQTEQLLGFTVGSVTPQVAQACQLEDRSGVVITNVRSFSSAESAGVGPCQTIREVNGQAVRRPEDVARIAAGLEPGSIVSMRVRDPRLGETLINYQIRR